MAGKDLDPGTHLFYGWSSDEHRPERLTYPVDLEIRLERIDLAPVGITAHDYVHEIQSERRVLVTGDGLGHQDRPRARSIEGHARSRSLGQQV